MEHQYWKNKKVLVTGGQGFIGSHFVEELSVLGSSTTSINRSPKSNHLDHVDYDFMQLDLLDREALREYCEKNKFDCIVHCAALDGNSEFKLKNAARILDTNTQLISNILYAAESSGVEDIILLSSTEIYATSAPDSISEDDDYHRHFTFTEDGYVLSKIFGEISAELHRKQHNMNIYTPRPTNVYGPRDGLNSKASRVIPSMIGKVAAGEKIEIWGDGTQTRSFIYVKDLVHATLEMARTKSVGPMNVATKDQVSIHDLALQISAEFGAEDNVTLDLSKPTGAKSRILDVSKMYNVISFEPIPIDQGLKQTIEWYREAANSPNS